jgi:CBS domain-containing protein
LNPLEEEAMKVSEIMTRDVCIARPDHTIEDVARMMLAIDAGLLPVGDDDQLVGTITDRDIAVRAIAEGKGPRTPVSEVMSGDVKYCYEDEDTGHVAQNMGELQVRRLPVLNRSKRLVGILSLADLAQAERGQRVGNALRQIAQPGGDHTQGADQRSGGM